MRKSIILITISLILVMILYVSYNNRIVKLKTSSKVSNEIIDINLESRINESLNFKFEDYFTVGWLQVQGTNIDLPIFTPMLPYLEVTGELNVDFSYGWRSTEFISGENREVLLGHNILNVSSNPITNDEILTDFEDIMSFVYYDFAQKNLYIKYTKDGIEDIYVIYAAGFYNTKDDTGISLKEEEQIANYIAGVKNESIYDYDVDVGSQDSLISIITCTRFFGPNYNNQFKIDARKLRKNEKTYLYKVTTNENYDEVKKRLDMEIG